MPIHEGLGGTWILILKPILGECRDREVKKGRFIFCMPVFAEFFTLEARIHLLSSEIAEMCSKLPDGGKPKWAGTSKAVHGSGGPGPFRLSRA
jgi:hypothetical protein